MRIQVEPMPVLVDLDKLEEALWHMKKQGWKKAVVTTVPNNVEFVHPETLETFCACASPISDLSKKKGDKE